MTTPHPSPGLRRLVRAVVPAATCLLALTACDFTGVNSKPLPFGAGSGEDAITITVTMNSVGNLAPNSEVKLDDLTVGSVRKIEFEDWKAELTLGLEPDVELPANATARIGQKSLLGAQYVELAPPAKGARGTLADGANIPESATGAYPDTEQVLTAAGTLLSGGGLENIATITSELNDAFGGHESEWRALLVELNTLTREVNDHRHELVGLIDGSSQLAGRLAAERPLIDSALRILPQAVEVLDSLRPRALAALRAIRQLGRSALPLIRQSKGNLVADLKSIAQVLSGIGAAGKDLPGALGYATFPLPIDSVTNVVRGDYINFFLNIDLTLATLDKNFLSGSPLEGVLTGVNQLPPAETSLDAEDPLLAPLKPADTGEDQAGDEPDNPLPDPPGIVPSDDAPESGLLDELFHLLGGGS